MIIEKAREWLGTPYHHGAALKNVGCDCFGLIRGIYKDLTGIAVEPTVQYSPQWFSNDDTKNRLLENLDYMAYNVDTLIEGDILVFSLKEQLFHCAIYNKDTFIHCYEDVLKTVETGYSEKWKRLHRLTYRFKWPH